MDVDHVTRMQTGPSPSWLISVPSVSGCDDLAGKTVIDVGGWTSTADGLGYVTNKCSNMPYSDSIAVSCRP